MNQFSRFNLECEVALPNHALYLKSFFAIIFLREAVKNAIVQI